MTDLICVGAIAGSYGVNGDVRIKSFCATPEDIQNYTPLTSEDGQSSYVLTLGQPIKNGFKARLSGVLSKEKADELKGIRLYAARDQLPSLPDDEYYHADLIGLNVYDTGGALLGSVKSVLNHGASDLLEIKQSGSSLAVLLPFTLEAVPTVDLEQQRIVADPPEGLF
ncbi:MAG: ribosome maturation factor RimM [Paracoccaceae bacterium]